MIMKMTKIMPPITPPTTAPTSVVFDAAAAVGVVETMTVAVTPTYVVEIPAVIEFENDVVADVVTAATDAESPVTV